MNPALAKLREEIKRCEDFIALCERIKHLERFDAEHLTRKREKLELDQIEINYQQNMVSEELHRLQAALTRQFPPLGSFEVEQLNALIQSARIRKGSLEQSANSTVQGIERIHRELIDKDQELQRLYIQLEQLISEEGFDPNSIHERLANLQKEKDAIKDELKAEITSRRDPSREQQMPGAAKGSSTEGTKVFEAEFYTALSADLAKAKKSVEIISPFLSDQRAQEIMAELATVAKRGCNVVVYTRPPNEQKPDAHSTAQSIITNAHRLMITVIQRSGIEYNAAIIDGVICWEGGINILGASEPKQTMKRTVASSHVRELRHFLSQEYGQG